MRNHHDIIRGGFLNEVDTLWISPIEQRRVFKNIQT
jgi:hypothetical protein